MSEQQAGSGGDNTPPDDVEPISFVLSKTRSQLPDSTIHPLIEISIAVGSVAAISLIMAFAGFSGVLGALAVASLSAYVYQRAKLQSSFTATGEARQFVPVDGARIHLSGHRSDLSRVTPPCNVPFEPAVFERVYAGASFVTVFFSGILLGNIMLIAARRWLPSWLNSGFLAGIYPTFGVLVLWVVSRLFPTYYRITPGRLEIMRFSPIINRSRILERWDLQAAKLRVAFELPMVALRDGGRETKIRLRGISEPFKFVEALLMGAVSTYSAPSLPDDELVG